ncbi:MAG TPA: ABC transporter ATP-binding protein [candidate division Zixibacteria bacterium]|nr:ABC transporter ATP-binding protein [candidate division Zixibacteria bacterium]
MYASDPTQVALTVSNLSLTLDGVEILRGVSFSVRERELVALVGPNGAGKTSALKSALGIYRGAGGSVVAGGAEMIGASATALACRFGYVPQQEERALDYTVAEFVEMALYAQGLRYGLARETSARVTAALERVEMSDFAERSLRTLSGGELQKVYLAGALAQGAQVLLLDEPTSFLDPHHRHDVIRILLESLRAPEMARSALLVTHDLNLALSCADRIVALKAGVVAFDGSPQAFCDPALISEIYDIRMRFGVDPVTQRPFVYPTTLDLRSEEGQ